MATDPPRIDLSTPTVVVGLWRNLVITEWRARSSAEDMSVAYDLQRRYIRQLSRKIVSLTVVPGAVIRPLEPEARKVLDQAVLDIHPSSAAAALVLHASGFGGAMIRSILTSLNFLRRTDFPNKILASLPDASEFLAPYIEGAPTPAAVEVAYQAVLAAPPTP